MAKYLDAWVTRDVDRLDGEGYYLTMWEEPKYDARFGEWPSLEGGGTDIGESLAIKLIGCTLPGGAKSIRRVRA